MTSPASFQAHGSPAPEATSHTSGNRVQAVLTSRSARNPELLAALQVQGERAYGPPSTSPALAARFSTSYADYCFLGPPEDLQVVVESRLGNQMLIAPPGVALVRSSTHSGPHRSAIPVLALGYGGLLVPNQLEPEPARLDRVRVCWKGGEVRLAIAPPPTNSVHGGSTTWLSLDTARSEDVALWRENVTQLFHPNTGVSCSDTEAFWNVFEASGYFHLSDRAAPDFEPRKRDWMVASAALQRAPDLGIQVAYYQAGRIEGTMAATALWEHSWFFFQLARPQQRSMFGSNNRVLYDLYRRSYEHATRDPRTRWHVAYIQRDGSSFTRHVNYELARRHEGPEAATVEFRAIEVPCAGVQRDISDDVSPASRGELKQLLEVIAASRPRPYVESLDFVPERFQLVELSERWAAAGLERKREVLVARRGTRAVAAAVLEFAQRGLHLFGLMDCVRTFSLDSDGHQAFEALLEAARQRYTQQGRRAFIYMDEHGLGTALPTGSLDLGVADVVTISADLTVELLDDVLISATAAQRRLAEQLDDVGLDPIRVRGS